MSWCQGYSRCMVENSQTGQSYYCIWTIKKEGWNQGSLGLWLTFFVKWNQKNHSFLAVTEANCNLLKVQHIFSDPHSETEIFNVNVPPFLLLSFPVLHCKTPTSGSTGHRSNRWQIHYQADVPIYHPSAPHRVSIKQGFGSSVLLV